MRKKKKNQNKDGREHAAKLRAAKRESCRSCGGPNSISEGESGDGLLPAHKPSPRQEPRQTTSNIGHLSRPTITALVHGLNRNYYSIAINCRKGELEHQMLANLHTNKWSDALKLKNYQEHQEEREESIAALKELSCRYTSMIEEEIKKKPEQLLVDRAGQIDAKMRIQQTLDQLMTDTLLQSLGSMISTLVF
ncbi:26S proteasome non-ATPase subunit, putative [Eimeria tenella]|uniref:26S proteasome non-ATPase subunit, putative n=1 Tax=Eimeria tenella TaxID=5802 RepID=U6KI87_EIMTE|nr:26S proteasome non-ATPase subunit, putative [Eimeria tenella]CDJ37654.1 26S proteasome non-ATPase subunit, putative [Eimeria tenella]|eukprot:XP_013228492.1 26S proteasome non-ATPase subunit, putative [Eimeria tenella]